MSSVCIIRHCDNTVTQPERVLRARKRAQGKGRRQHIRDANFNAQFQHARKYWGHMEVYV